MILTNSITASRIAFATLILFVPAFSTPFYIFYILGGLSDMIDGTVARALKQSSPFGAKLDTIADFVFIAAVFIKIVTSVTFPLWVWVWTAAIAVVKVINLISGFVISRRLVAVHSVMNKITGALLFVLPFTMGIKRLPEQVLNAEYILACSVATFAAIQEGHYMRTGKKIN